MGLNYHKVLNFCEALAISEIYYLERLPMGQIAVNCLGPCKVRSITLDDIKSTEFFVRLQASMAAGAP